MVKLYTYNIDTNTGEISQCVNDENEGHYDGLSEEEVGYASYDEDGFENVYAESLVSAEDAQDLVFEKCKELRDKFQNCVDLIFKSPDYPSYTQAAPKLSSGMKAYTDYPIVALGDEPHKDAPIREVWVIDYDGNKYCDVLLADGLFAEIKADYLYKERGRCGEVECIDTKVFSAGVRYATVPEL